MEKYKDNIVSIGVVILFICLAWALLSVYGNRGNDGLDDTAKQLRDAGATVNTVRDGISRDTERVERTKEYNRNIEDGLNGLSETITEVEGHIENNAERLSYAETRVGNIEQKLNAIQATTHRSKQLSTECRGVFEKYREKDAKASLAEDNVANNNRRVGNNSSK